MTFPGRRGQSKSETCDSLARQREHVEREREREWVREGEHSSHIRSPPQCNSVRFLSSPQRKSETGRRGKQRVHAGKKKGWDVKRVLVLSRAGHQAPACIREEVIEKKRRRDNNKK